MYAYTSTCTLSICALCIHFIHTVQHHVWSFQAKVVFLLAYEVFGLTEMTCTLHVQRLDDISLNFRKCRCLYMSQKNSDTVQGSNRG